MATILDLLADFIATIIGIIVLLIAYLDLLPPRDKTKGDDRMGYVGKCPKCGHEGEHRLKKRKDGSKMTWTMTGRTGKDGEAPILRVCVFQCSQCRKSFRKAWQEGVVKEA